MGDGSSDGGNRLLHSSARENMSRGKSDIDQVDRCHRQVRCPVYPPFPLFSSSPLLIFPSSHLLLFSSSPLPLTCVRAAALTSLSLAL